MTTRRLIQMISPYGYWRMEDEHGSILTLPNGLIGWELADGKVSFFNGRILAQVPAHWRKDVSADGAPEQTVADPMISEGRKS